MTFLLQKTTLVRRGFSEQDTWRDALGPQEPLHVFSILGQTLDAPELLPAGALRSTQYGPQHLVTFLDSFN